MRAEKEEGKARNIYYNLHSFQNSRKYSLRLNVGFMLYLPLKIANVIDLHRISNGKEVEYENETNRKPALNYIANDFQT